MISNPGKLPEPSCRNFPERNEITKFNKVIGFWFFFATEVYSWPADDFLRTSTQQQTC
jgi:hypothetical protein